METNPIPAEQLLRIGTVMCVIWLVAGTMLIGQAQRTGFGASALIRSSRAPIELTYQRHAPRMRGTQ